MNSDLGQKDSRQENASDLMVVRHAVISNRLGLHARAAAKFAKLAAGFDAHIRIAKEDTQVSALSILGLMMLAASRGCEIKINAHGPQAQEAAEALADLVRRKFDET